MSDAIVKLVEMIDWKRVTQKDLAGFCQDVGCSGVDKRCPVCGRVSEWDDDTLDAAEDQQYQRQEEG